MSKEKVMNVKSTLSSGSKRNKFIVAPNIELMQADRRTKPDLAFLGGFCGIANSAAITHPEIFKK